MRLSAIKLFILALCLTALIPALAIDLLPGDIVAPRPGGKMLLVSYLTSERNDLYKNNVVTRGIGIKSEQIQIRTAWTFEVDKYPAAFTLQLNGGSVQPTGGLSHIRSGSSGLGDTTLLFALWPYSHSDMGEYIAIGTYLTLPTGEYQSTPNFNFGANRYSSAFQLGYQRALSSSLQWMSAIDASQFGANADYRAPLPLALTHPPTTLDQKTLYSLQTGLRYIINDAYSLSAMYFHTVGGEEMINRIDQHNRLDLHRYQLTASAQLPTGRLILQYGGDIQTQNGFYETSRIILRYATPF